jgi:DNA-binding FrmR family transcriptional regulator
MPAKAASKKTASKTAAAKKPVPVVITNAQARTDLLNRLKRAEGQLRGVQRMIEDGEECLKIGQQFSAVRKALDSTYMRMTMCFLTQELQERLSVTVEDTEERGARLKDMETMLTRLN